MCEDLCVHGLVEYKRCLYYENGKKVIEARWRGNPIILKSKLENFSSYEPLGILDYQVTPFTFYPNQSKQYRSIYSNLWSTGHSRGALSCRCGFLRHSGSKSDQHVAKSHLFCVSEFTAQIHFPLISGTKLSGAG